MHPSTTVKWESVLAQVRSSNYRGYEPKTPFWFGNSPELNAELNLLVSSGKKTATASLLWQWELAPIDPPKIGQCDALLGWENEFLGILVATAVHVVPFIEVTEEFAALEGEGDLTLEFWRDAHWSYFSQECIQLGKQPSESMPVVCYEFNLEYLSENEQ